MREDIIVPSLDASELEALDNLTVTLSCQHHWRHELCSQPGSFRLVDHDFADFRQPIFTDRCDLSPVCCPDRGLPGLRVVRYEA